LAIIGNTSNAYKVSWLVDGKVSAIGVGMEIENG
jgi:hypothetical protein